MGRQLSNLNNKQLDGIILVDKSSGMTSQDCISIIKKKLNVKKIGHTGTLDPFATGLMIVLLGKATKIAYLFDGLDKKYQGNCLAGKLYDTLDTSGEVLKIKEYSFSQLQLDDAIKKYNETSYEQTPPKYSAIKINGKKLYEYARANQEVIIPTRNVKIYSLELNINNDYSVDYKCHVSKGTYVRSLINDIGADLNTYLQVNTLRRIQQGNICVKNAVKLENIDSSSLIDLKSYLLNNYEIFKCKDYLINLVKNGVRLDERQLDSNKPFIVVDKEENILALYDLEKDLNSKKSYKPIIIF